MQNTSEIRQQVKPLLHFDRALGGDLGKAALCTEKGSNELPPHTDLLSSGSLLSHPDSFTLDEGKASTLQGEENRSICFSLNFLNHVSDL